MLPRKNQTIAQRSRCGWDPAFLAVMVVAPSLGRRWGRCYESIAMIVSFGSRLALGGDPARVVLDGPSDVARRVLEEGVERGIVEARLFEPADPLIGRNG